MQPVTATRSGIPLPCSCGRRLDRGCGHYRMNHRTPSLTQSPTKTGSRRRGDRQSHQARPQSETKESRSAVLKNDADGGNFGNPNSNIPDPHPHGDGTRQREAGTTADTADWVVYSGKSHIFRSTVASPRVVPVIDMTLFTRCCTTPCPESAAGPLDTSAQARGGRLSDNRCQPGQLSALKMHVFEEFPGLGNRRFRFRFAPRHITNH